ncbi:MAG: hypothetical protein ACOYMA_20290 [Bacteroidia bacterium]
MNDRKRIKILLKKIDLTTFTEITSILLKFGFDRGRAIKFLDSIVAQKLIEIVHNNEIKFEILDGKKVLLKDLNIKAKKTFEGEKYFYQNLTLIENIKSDWWKLVLVNIPGLIVGALISYFLTHHN